MDISIVSDGVINIALTPDELETNPLNVVIPPEIDGQKITNISSITWPEDISYRQVILTFPEGLISIDSFAFNYDTTIKEVNLPKTLKKISESAFSTSEIQKVNIPEGSSLTIIQPSAFQHIPIEKIFIPKGVSTISNAAFANCSSLTTVEFEEKSKCKSIKDRAFAFCSKLKSFKIPDSVETIGKSTFENCEELCSFSISSDKSKLKTIGQFAFNNCVQLKTVNINSKALKEVNSSQFSDCYYIEELDISDCDIESIENFGTAMATLKKIILPNKCKVIKDSAFEGTSLQEVVFPDGLVEIGEKAFSHSKLEKVKLPNSIKKIGWQAFKYCKIKEINFAILMNLESIGDSAFAKNNFEHIDVYPMKCPVSGLYSQNEFLESVTFYDTENNITEIGNNMFYSCPKLKTINLEDLKNLKIIGPHAFNQCSFDNITFPESLQEIGDSAFYKNQLTEVDLSSTIINTIGASAFAKNKIEEVKVSPWLGKMKTNAFSENPNTTLLADIKIQAAFCEFINS